MPNYTIEDVLVIIPARKGSKGIPHKNSKPFLNKPLIQYSIEFALKEGIKNHHIVLTSNDSHVLDIGKKFDLTLIKRPEELCTDLASTELAIEHVLNNISKKPCITSLLQPTSPYRKKGRLNEALNLLINDRLDTLVSGTKLKGFTWNKENKSSSIAQPSYDPQHRPMRQIFLNQTSQYVENGSIYLFKTESFSKFKCRLFGKIGLLEMSDEESIEIDEWIDWITLETIMKHKETHYG